MIRTYLAAAVFLLLAINLMAEIDTRFKIDIINSYNSNILELSDHDLDSFEKDTNPEKFKIESSDDFVSEIRLNFSLKHRYFLNHTQINKISLKYNKYWNNEGLADYYLNIGTTQYLSRKINFSLNYFYFPEIYSNRYYSVLDRESQYRDFTYAKNQYDFRFYWRVIEMMRLAYELDYSQLLFNEYFTEYDADNITNSFSCRIYPVKKYYFDLEYGFRISNADGADAYTDPERFEVIKDASYEADIYSIKVNGEFLRLKSGRLTFGAGYNYKQYFFQTDKILDTYHVDRKDNISYYEIFAEIPIHPGKTVKVEYSYETRDTESPFQIVERDKSFERYKVVFALSLEF